MKSIFFLLVFSAFFSMSCKNSNTTEHNHEGIHTHDDGSVHENHEDTLHQQEEFKVEADTSQHSHDPDNKNDDHQH